MCRIATLWHLFKVGRVSRWQLPRIPTSAGGTTDGDLRTGVAQGMEMGLLLTPFHKCWALAVCSGKHRVKGKGLIKGDLLATWKIRNGASAWGLMAHISSGTWRQALVLTLPSWDVMPVLPPQPSGGLCSGQGIGVVRSFFFSSAMWAPLGMVPQL